MMIFHVVIDTMSGNNALKSICIEKSFKNRSEAVEYIDRELSDIDPDLIDIQFSYLDLGDE